MISIWASAFRTTTRMDSAASAANSASETMGHDPKRSLFGQLFERIIARRTARVRSELRRTTDGRSAQINLDQRGPRCEAARPQAAAQGNSRR
jgi:hypothetical protein